MANAEERQLRASSPFGDGISSRWYLIGVSLYAAIVAIVMWRRGGFIEADLFLFFLVFAALVLGQLRSFLRDWIPFAIVLFGWQLLRGYADQVADGRGFTLHDADLVAMERSLFGGELPTLWLQDKLYDPGVVHWYDVAATAFWSFHFVLALAFAFLLWMRSRSEYWRFVYSLLLLSFAGFFTYILFPAVPPWLAARRGTIQDTVWMVRDELFRAWSWGSNVSKVMEHGNPNVVAAMPSLHAAYPMLVFLFCCFYWKKLAPFALFYCFCLWFSIVYLGDHYVIDALAGIAYATAAFFAIEWLGRWVARRRDQGRPAEALTEEATG